MKTPPGSVKTSDKIRLRGDLTVTITNVLTGHTSRRHVRNTITYNGLNSSLYLWAQDGISVTDYQIAELVPGKNSTPPTRGDLGVVDPVDTADRLPLTSANRTVSPATGELVISATLGTGQANGLTLCEVGLILGNGQLFARQVHPNFTKSSAFTLTYTWRIAVTA